MMDACEVAENGTLEDLFANAVNFTVTELIEIAHTIGLREGQDIKANRPAAEVLRLVPKTMPRITSK